MAGSCGSGISCADEVGELRELLPAPLARQLGDLRIDVIGEVLKRAGLVVLLALKQHRGAGREDRAERGQSQITAAEAITEGSISHLVVVLSADDELAALRSTQLIGHVDEPAVPGVVGLVFTGQEHVQRVMERVLPLGIVTPLVDRSQIADLHLGDEQGSGIDRLDALAELGHHVRVRVVDDRVRGVETQAVDAVVPHPHLGVLDRPLAHRRLGVIDRLAPDRPATFGQIRAEGGDRVGAGAHVVVDDIEDHSQPRRVGGGDEAGEALGTAIGGMGRRGVDTVVTPAVVAGEGGDRHDLDRRDAKLAELAQPRDGPLERARGGKRADVELVDHEIAQGDAGEAVGGVAQGGEVDDA